MDVDSAWASIAEILHEHASARAAEGSWEAARALLEAAIPAAPTSERLRLDLAHALHQLGDREGALRECEIAAQLPGAAEAALHAARFSALAGRPAAAVEGWLDICLARDPLLVQEFADYPEFDSIRGGRPFVHLVEGAWDNLQMSSKRQRVVKGP